VATQPTEKVRERCHARVDGCIGSLMQGAPHTTQRLGPKPRIPSRSDVLPVPAAKRRQWEKAWRSSTSDSDTRPVSGATDEATRSQKINRPRARGRQKRSARSARNVWKACRVWNAVASSGTDEALASVDAGAEAAAVTGVMQSDGDTTGADRREKRNGLAGEKALSGFSRDHQRQIVAPPSGEPGKRRSPACAETSRPTRRRVRGRRSCGVPRVRCHHR